MWLSKMLAEAADVVLIALTDLAHQLKNTEDL